MIKLIKTWLRMHIYLIISGFSGHQSYDFELVEMLVKPTWPVNSFRSHEGLSTESEFSSYQEILENLLGCLEFQNRMKN